MTTIIFKGSNLESTINTVNYKEGLENYKIACENAVEHWKNEKLKNTQYSDENIKFFSDALELTTKKLKNGK